MKCTAIASFILVINSLLLPSASYAQSNGYTWCQGETIKETSTGVRALQYRSAGIRDDEIINLLVIEEVAYMDTTCRNFQKYLNQGISWEQARYIIGMQFFSHILSKFRNSVGTSGNPSQHLIIERSLYDTLGDRNNRMLEHGLCGFRGCFPPGRPVF